MRWTASRLAVAGGFDLVRDDVAHRDLAALA